jgi:histidyl-tRNA synthetase
LTFLLPKGLRDIEPEEFRLFENLRDSFLEVSKLTGFRIMEPSSIELLSTLEAKSGPSIRDEIYCFKDKSGDELGLRFDLTVGITRWVTSRKDLQPPIKIGAFSGMWRYDNPQYGRYRWFNQWDIEIYGPKRTESDAEVIEFCSLFFEKVGLHRVLIEIGDRESAEEYIRSQLEIKDEATILEMLRAVDKLGKKSEGEILQEYRNRIPENKLSQLLKFGRISGSGEKVFEELNKNYKINHVLQLEKLADSLRSRGIKNFSFNMSIVRGIDYYTGVVFEAYDPSSRELGSLCGGGRYDSLPSIYGRKDLGATGVAGGVERAILSLGEGSTPRPSKTVDVFVATVGEELTPNGSELTSELRRNGISAEQDLVGRSLRKQLELASTLDATYTVIIGQKEVASGKFTVRNMRQMKEETVDKREIVSYLKKRP